MSLFDDLRSAAKALDPQFQVSSNEVTSVLSALVHYTEHGDSFLKAVESGAQDVADLLNPPAAPAAETPPATDAPAPTVAELEAQISDLNAQLAARQATDQQTQVEHQPAAPPTEPPAA